MWYIPQGKETWNVCEANIAVTRGIKICDGIRSEDFFCSTGRFKWNSVSVN